MSAVVSAVRLRAEKGPRFALAALAVTCIVVTCIALGWAIVEGGPVVAVAPILLGVAAAVIVAGLARPLGVLFALGALISAFPVARVVGADVPLYLTDALAALALVAVLVSGTTRRHPFRLVIGVYLLAWLPAWLYQVVRIDLYLEPTYGLVRNALAVVIALAAFEIVKRRPDAVLGLVLALAGGTIITAILALAQAVPPTSDAARTFLTTISPAFVPGAYDVYPERAFALFPAPTALAGFLAMMLPLFLVSIGVARGRAHTLLVTAVGFAGFALIATYSRQWAPALALGLITLAVLRPSAFRRSVLLGAVVVAGVGFALSSGSLNSDYLNERFSSLGGGDANVQLRLERQRAFFATADASSADTLLGRGFAGQDIAARDLTDARTTDELRAGFNDNSFLLEWFNHGILAAAMYLLIVLGVTAAAARGARRTGEQSALLAGLSATLVTAIALHFFDNYMSEAIYMKMILWILIGATAGLLAAQRAGSGGEPHG